MELRKSNNPKGGGKIILYINVSKLQLFFHHQDNSPDLHFTLMLLTSSYSCNFLIKLKIALLGCVFSPQPFL